jgi:hypothetical protein
VTLATNQGATAVIPASWSVNGAPADPSALTITITANLDGSVVVPATDDGVYHASTGNYQFSWAVSTEQATGDYTAVWNATLSGSAASQAVGITVQDVNFGQASLKTWCDISLTEDLINGIGNVNSVDPVWWVYNVTGSTLTTIQIQSAQQILNMFSNYTPESSGFNMNPQDLAWLRYGLAYQAVWMPAQVGLLQRDTVRQMSQDGLSFTLDDTQGTDRTMMLAPLALRSLKQLSWQKSRSLRVRTPFIDDQTPISSDPDAEANDLYERWVDMYNFGYRGSSVP